MEPLPKISKAPFGLGAASFVLGAIGLLLCVLPILGAPISSIGLIAGIVGCSLGFFGSTSNFRWSAAGVALSSLALVVNLAIAYVPAVEVPARQVPQIQPAVPKRSYVPPPRRSPYTSLETSPRGKTTQKPAEGNQLKP